MFRVMTMLLVRPPRKILDREIDTGFRKWLRFGVMLDAPLTPGEKAVLALVNTLGSVPDDAEKWLREILLFYNCGQPARGKPAKERLLDWEKDSPAIWADFKIYAGIDLDKADMHWWEFYALFASLPGDSLIKQRISTRSIDLSKIKDKDMRREYAEQKALVALDRTADSESLIDELYERMV